MAVQLTINGSDYSFDGDPKMPLLWYLHDYARLRGTKFGCGIAVCGACTVHVDGSAMPACAIAVGDLEGRTITTIEGLAAGSTLHALQQAWIDEDVPQCGYCQPGFIMAAAGLLSRKEVPDDDDIAGLTNICRCGTYPRIRKAIHRAARSLAEQRNS